MPGWGARASIRRASGSPGSCAVNGWEGESGRRKVRTTIIDRSAKAASDRVGRDFNPTAPNVTWCGDITYLRTGEGWLYLATVIDLFSRRVIGWSLAEHMRTTLVADALNTAVATRGGHVDGVIFHSDRGCQYTSAEFGELCERLGVVQSMGATGVCWDNAAAESFFGSAEARARSPPALGHPGRGPPRRDPLDRRLVQLTPAPLEPQLLHPDRDRDQLVPSSGRHRRITNPSAEPGQPQSFGRGVGRLGRREPVTPPP